MRRTRFAYLIFAACLYAPHTALSQERVAFLQQQIVKAPAIRASVAPGKHATLLQVIDAAGMTAVLQNSSGFTIFAPTNSAFSRLPKSRLDTLLDPKHKSELKSVMANHVIRGSLGLAEIKQAVLQGNGTAAFKTLGGNQLTFRLFGTALTVTNAQGQSARISAANFQQGGNRVHAVDRIFL